MTKPRPARWKPLAARLKPLAARLKSLAARSRSLAPHRKSLAARSRSLAPHRKSLAAPLVAGVLLAAAPSAAHAGAYAVVGCADLAGATTPSHVTRPADGWFLEQGVYPSRQDCAAGRNGLGIYATGSHGADLFRLNAPADTTIAWFAMTYRAHLSGAESWATPTFVVEAGHRGGWEYVGPARGWIGAAPIDFGGDDASGNAHGADALRIGTRCGQLGPCVKGGQPEARVRAITVVLADDRAPEVDLTLPEGHVRRGIEVAVRAADTGGGVFERSVTVDGRSLAGGALCPTVPASLGRMRHVLRRVPCPLDAPWR